MKFTEEQYREIVKAWNEGLDWRESVDAVLKVVRKMRLYSGLSYGRAIALGNPVTREWAHDQFVEKEKRYVWRLQNDTDKVINTLDSKWFLDALDIDRVQPDDVDSSIKFAFTETEIKNSPFKPEWFDKEEVE